MTSFVHLRSHSQYSFKEGLIPVKKDKKRPKIKLLANYAAESNQEALALTDIHGVFGMVSFYGSTREKGIKPIIGSDVWIEPDVTRPEDSRHSLYRLNLLSQNETGYKRLMELISRSNLDNHIDKIPRIKQSWLMEDSTGLIALSGDGTHGELASLLVDGAGEKEFQQAEKVVQFYKGAFPDRYFLEVQRYDQPNEFEQVAGTVELSQMHNVPLVATHPILFGKRSDFYAHEIRAAIAEGTVVTAVDYKTEFTPEQYFKSTEEMQELFEDLPQALENTALIAQKCSSEIELNNSYLPHIESEDGLSEPESLEKLSFEGLEKRLLINFPDPVEREKVRSEYESRLKVEIDIINNMGFPGYFLIVADFIGWAKENDIPIGPGRGSGAGSLVAYALSITNIDPLPHGLLFERFLNPERVSMPDFDIDMDIFRREEIIDYVRNKYGHESVAQIATFGTNDVKGAIRGVVRATGTAYEVGDIISKLIVDDPGLTIATAMEQPELKQRYESSPIIKKVLELAQLIEGSVAGIGTHAAGVLISPTKISDFSPLHYTSEKDMEKEKKKDARKKTEEEAKVIGKKKSGASLVSQYDKDDVESVGLVKFDFLGLATLSMMKLTTDMIAKDLNKKIDLDLVDLNDPKAMEVFKHGNTVGVFQFESSGMQGLLRGCKASSFSDVTALNALYRPGPMDLIPTFQNRKLGLEEVKYPDERVADLLKETQGIMIYQEQVMKVAQILGGYSLAGADMLRRAMGKKKVEEMAANRETFAKGAGEKGISREKADDLFDLIETFSGYGFNKSHAAAYSMVAVQTAFLKSHYPAYFYASHLSMGGVLDAPSIAKMSKFVGDMRNNNVELLSPDINKSETLFSVEDGQVRYALAAIRGIGQPIANKIVSLRKDGDYESVYDFVRRFGHKNITEKFLTALVGSGAFDSLHPNRAQLLAAIPDLVDYSAALNKKGGTKNVKVIPQDAFGFGDTGKKPRRSTKKTDEVEAVEEVTIPEPALPLEYSLSTQEVLSIEQGLTGFYISLHPFDNFAASLQGIPSALPLSKLDDFNPEEERRSFLVAGVITKYEAKTAKSSGKKMVNMEISDGPENRSLVVFSGSLDKLKNQGFEVGSFIAAEVKIRSDFKDPEGPNTMMLEDCWNFAKYEARQARSLFIVMNESGLKDIQEVADRFPIKEKEVPMKIVVYLPVDENSYNKIELDSVRIPNTIEAIRELKSRFPAEQLKFGFDREFKFEPRAYQNKKSYNKGPR